MTKPRQPKTRTTRRPKHRDTDNLLEGWGSGGPITDFDELQRTADRLEAEGRMPSLASLEDALREAFEEVRAEWEAAGGAAPDDD